MSRHSLAQTYFRALRHRLLLVVWLVMPSYSMIAGPFGTLDGMSLARRAIYWPIVITAGILVGGFLRVVVHEWLGMRRFLGAALMIAALCTLILTFPVLIFTNWNALPGVEFSAARIALYVFGTSFTVTTLRYGVMMPPGLRRAPARPPIEAVPEPEVEPESEVAPASGELRILARLEPDLRAPLVRMQVRDHYVDVVTDAGSESLLMRLVDAIAETEGEAGMQVHRSHWVARRAMVSLHRGRGKVVLRMSDGAVVPVSRTYLAEVEAIGLSEVRLTAEFHNAAE